MTERTAMLSQRELLLLRLLSFASFTRVTLTLPDPQHVPAPEEKPERAKEIEPSLSSSLWFDYPDSDKEKILAVYKQIGEEPVFVPPSTFPQQLRLILVGSILLVVLLLLYQICSRVIRSKGTA